MRRVFSGRLTLNPSWLAEWSVDEEMEDELQKSDIEKLINTNLILFNPLTYELNTIDAIIIKIILI